MIFSRVRGHKPCYARAKAAWQGNFSSFEGGKKKGFGV
jgi:hypothetical protein